MQSSWESETGHLMCRWSEIGMRDIYNPQWMQEALAVPSGYLTPVPEFTSHSPFGAAVTGVERPEYRKWLLDRLATIGAYYGRPTH